MIEGISMKNSDRECKAYSCILIDVLLKNISGNSELLTELKLLKETQCKHVMD